MELKKTSWNDITITDYKKIVEISKRELDTDLEKDIAVLAILCNVKEADMYSMPLTELSALLTSAEWIKKPYTFNHNFKPHKIKIGDKQYMVNPDLDKFTVAQYMDFQNFWDRRTEQMGNLLAVFIIPVGCKYNEGYDVLELAQYLEDSLSITFWNEVCFFFLQSYLTSIQASTLYSAYMMKKQIRMEKDKQKKQVLKEKYKELMKQVKKTLLIG